MKTKTSGRRVAPARPQWHDGMRPPVFPAPAAACRRKFLRFFPRGFADPKYLGWERTYKWEAHQRWEEALGPAMFRRLLRAGSHVEIAARAVRIESRTNLLFSFEKMALRDAVRTPAGAQAFAEGLFALLHGRGNPVDRFGRWCEILAELPRRQTRVLTWPLATVFGFIAQPDRHIFLKPNVTRRAAQAYGYDFEYASRPTAEGYARYLEFATRVRRDVADLNPRDWIDIQSFLWVMGSDEYD
jgi:hypothetical protein